MNMKDFRIGWRTLVAEPAYSLVVIGGLGVGLAACLLLLGFVRYSWLYNSHVPDVERVYVVKLRHNVNPDAPWFDQGPMMLRAAAENIPGVEAVTSYLATRPQRTTARINGSLRHLNSLTVLPHFADILGVRTVRGDLAGALAAPEGMAITDRLALQAFGTLDVLDKPVKVEGRLLRVQAVVAAPPTNTTVPFDSLVGVRSLLVEDAVREELLTGSQGWWARLLVRVRADASVPAIEAALQRASDAAPFNQNLPPEVRQRLGARKPLEIALAPLRHAYFDRDIAPHFIFSAGQRGNPLVVGALALVAVLVLALAAINYVNLATVRVLRRQREIALRKVLGGGTRRIALQFLAESLLVASCATALGLLLAWLAEPLFAALVERQLDSVLAPANLGLALLLGLMLGGATAVYPAWIALRVAPAQALSGRQDSESARGLQVRRVLTVAQVAIGMSLAAVTLAIAWQTQFAMRASPGFDPAPLLVLDLPDVVDHDQGPAVRGLVAALTAQPGIAGVTVSADAVGRHQTMWMRELRRPGGVNLPVANKVVGSNFFQVYGLQPVAGRLYDPNIEGLDGSDTIVINAVTARQLGFVAPGAAVGQTIEFTDWDRSIKRRRVVGIAPELRFGSLHARPEAIAYEVRRQDLVLTIRARASVDEAERLVREHWPQHFPEGILMLQRAGAIVAANYAEDARLARLLAIATGIALAIAAFGAYALASHTVQRRAKEIVLRKLYGAGPGDIGRMVAREIGRLTGIAALIALPAGAVLIRLYLAGYVEHARPAAYWTLLLALACTVLVVSVAVARQAVAAMRMRPNAVLRT